MADTRWDRFYLHMTVMAGLSHDERVALIAKHDEHLANLEELCNHAASVGYRLNAIAPADPDATVDLRYPGMEAAYLALRDVVEHRWEQINAGGRLEDPALWTPDRA